MNNTNSTSWTDSAFPHHSHAGVGTTNPRLVTGIVVLMLLVLNVLGNSLVLFVYQFRVKPSVFSFYVKVLATLDISTGLTTMLLDIIIKMRPMDENILDLNSLCKVTHFQVYAQSLISGCVFTLIAYQRYRKICYPLEPGLTMRTAKRSLIIIVAVCIPLTIPSLVINGSQDIQVQVHKYIVNVTICRNDEKYKDTYYPSVFSIFLTSAFSLVLCLTIVFYALVAKALRQFERRSSMVSKNVSSSTVTHAINRGRGFTANSAEEGRGQSGGRSQLSRMSISSGESNDRISTQMYRVFATITIIFIVSYLPHLVVVVFRKVLRLDCMIMTFTERIFLDLAYNCPYLSTVANPVVYGYCNAEFRDRLRNIFFCRRRK